jgi:hypothetical protein
MVTTYILVTGIIYWTTLVPIFYLDGCESAWLFSISKLWMHTATPAAALLLHQNIRKGYAGMKPRLSIAYFYIYPALYVSSGMIHALRGEYLYPMFNPDMMHGWLGVGGAMVLMLGLFSGLYLLLQKQRNNVIDPESVKNV